MVLRRLILTCFFLLLVAGCSESPTGVSESEVPLEESVEASPFGPVRLELSGTIGSEDEDDYFFAIIRGIEVDAEDNVTVFDGALRNIRVFSPDGILKRSYELPSGEGPGEFQRASTFSLSADKERVYIYDMMNERITVLDYATFEYLNSFPLHETLHAKIDGGPDDTIYAVYSQLDLGDRPMIHVFTEDGVEMAAFERRHEMFLEYDQQRLQAAYNVTMAQTPSLIFVSFSLPYEIRVYNRSHELQRRFHRIPDFFGGTIQKGEWLYPSGYCSSIVIAGEELVLQIVTDSESDEDWVHAFDFSGRHRGVQNLSKGEWGKQVYIDSDALDSKGQIYGIAYEPFPRLVRFKITPDTPSKPSS